MLNYIRYTHAGTNAPHSGVVTRLPCAPEALSFTHTPRSDFISGMQIKRIIWGKLRILTMCLVRDDFMGVMKLGLRERTWFEMTKTDEG